ncbi:MAG: hypothetical protein D6751_12230 [Deltaproteobacteria bacterium]|nr:MAG: hypothetical protein D6751_12230 [Deltaproteobacteria bacterium]
MSQQKRTSCLICAWRENCAKRFTMARDETLFCPDFSEDLTLKISRPASEEGQADQQAGDE